MEGSSVYKILPEHNVYILKFLGELNMNSIKPIMIEVFSDKEYDSKFNGIIDFRNVNMNFKKEEIEIYFNFLASQNALNKRKVALLTETPSQVYHLTLFEEQSKKSQLPILFKIFSTLEASLDWLEIKYKDNFELTANIQEILSTKSNR
ncbi:MAG: hypothetical protein JXA77_17420 [Bacteroidales bacterium]|nr:hypothetical protein [Bacteroidales bacterium]MBN2817361.1 hypothetical protein [Bacteroidales bacterium]